MSLRLTTALGALALLLLAAGCSSYEVTTDYDSSADFAAYKSYAWHSTNPSMASGDALLKNPLLAKRVQDAVDQELRAKGITHVTTGMPDLFIAIHATTQEKLNITDWGYGYGARPYAWGPSVDVSQYTQGTLIIDFVDVKTKELVWRGIASGAVQEQGRVDPQEQEARVKDVVNAILMYYPPSK